MPSADGEGVESELEPNPARRRLPPLGAHRVHRLPAHLDVAVQRQPQGCEPVFEIGKLTLDLAIDHGLRDIDPDVVAERLERGTLVSFAVLVGSLDGERGAVVLAKILQGGSMPVEHGEGIVLRRAGSARGPRAP